jgi:hypothetical protein
MRVCVRALQVLGETPERGFAMPCYNVTAWQAVTMAE